MSCENSTPLATRYDDLFLKSAGPFFEKDTGSTDTDSTLVAQNFGITSEVFNEIKTFSRKLDLTDPFERFGRQPIIELTDELNEYFFNPNRGLDLSPYPSLKGRVNPEAPKLSYSEVADFISENEINIDSALSDLRNPNATLASSSTLSNLASLLDLYLNANIGLSLAQGLCGAIAKIFETILAILDLIPIFVKHLELARDILLLLTDPDFIKFAIQQIQQQIVIQIKKKILEVIDAIFAAIIKKILAILNRIKEIICSLNGNNTTVSEKMNEAYTDIKEFFSSLSLDFFKEKIEEFVERLAKEFERFTIENVSQLVVRLCNFIEGLQELLFGPVNDFQDFVSKVVAETQMLQSVSLINSKRAVEYGGLRISLPERKQIQEQARKSVNDSSASLDELMEGASTDYVTLTELSCEEATSIIGMDGPVPPYFTFSGSANEPYKEGTEIKNFMRTKPIVFARLMRMSKRTGYTYDVKEAFLLKPDEEIRGGSENTISSSGSSIKINIGGGEEWVSKTIISASQEGFVGIGVGADYIHLDIGPRELTWVDGYTAGFTDAIPLGEKTEASKYLELLERHKRREFVKKVI